jgi:hypothetical protein
MNNLTASNRKISRPVDENNVYYAEYKNKENLRPKRIANTNKNDNRTPLEDITNIYKTTNYYPSVINEEMNENSPNLVNKSTSSAKNGFDIYSTTKKGSSTRQELKFIR